MAVESGVPQGTVLGTLTFFFTSINELPQLLKSSTILFGYDVKIWRTVKSEAYHFDLQADLEE